MKTLEQLVIETGGDLGKIHQILFTEREGAIAGLPRTGNDVQQLTGMLNILSALQAPRPPVSPPTAKPPEA